MSSTSDIISFLLTERKQRNLQGCQEQGHDIFNILSNELRGNHIHVPGGRHFAVNEYNSEMADEKGNNSEIKPQLVLERNFSFTHQNEIFNPFTFLINAKIKKNEDCLPLSASRTSSGVLSLEDGISQNLTRSDTESANSLDNSLVRLLKKKRNRENNKKGATKKVKLNSNLKCEEKTNNSKTKEEYSEEYYQKDLESLECDSRHKFMKSNFPTMYSKQNVIHYLKLQEKRKGVVNETFMIRECKLNQLLLQLKNQNIIGEEYKSRLLWKPGQLNESDFLKEVQRLWPFDVCKFSVELALEYLMKSDYNSEECLKDDKKIRDFLSNKGEIGLINENKKTNYKKYNLRNKKEII